MKKKIISLLFTVIIIAYFFLVPREILRETGLKPLWEADIPETDNLVLFQGDAKYPFKLGNRFGYLDNEGRPVLAGKAAYDVAISSSSFINYSNVQGSLILRNTRGGIINNLITRSYPFFLRDRLFLISPDRTGISELNISGESRWSRSFSSIISCADVNSENLLLGLVNGKFYLLDLEGKEIFSYEPGGSRLSAVYGCALSADSSLLAAISGIDPQRLVVLESRNNSYRAVVVFNLEQERRKSQYLAFSEDGAFLFYEGTDEIKYFEVRGSKKGELELKGSLNGSFLSGYGGISGFTSAGEGRVYFNFFSPSGGSLFAKEVKGNNPYLNIKDGVVVIGSDSSLLGIRTIQQ